MLAVSPKDATRQLLQKLAKDMDMRWRMVTEKRQEFLGRPLSRTTTGYLFGVADDYVKQLCTDFGFGELKGANNLVFEKHQEDDSILDGDGQRWHRQILGRLLWLDRPDIRNAVCQLSMHVGTPTNRDEANVK